MTKRGKIGVRKILTFILYILLFFIIMGCIGGSFYLENPSIETVVTSPKPECVHQIESIIYDATYFEKGYKIDKCTICDYQKRTDLSKCLLPIQFVYNFYEIDFLGRVTLDFNINNLTQKEIKYIYFDLVFYNAVGDIIKCDIDHQYTHSWQVTGPIQDKIQFRPSGFYNQNFKGGIAISNVRIIFMDNTTLSLIEANYNINELLVVK